MANKFKVGDNLMPSSSLRLLIKKMVCRNKFAVGDKVVLNPHDARLPKWLKDAVRTWRIRTIEAMFYDTKTQHTRYYLGFAGYGTDISRYPFRAEMLKKYEMKRSTKRLKLRHSTINVGKNKVTDYGCGIGRALNQVVHSQGATRNDVGCIVGGS